jgi:hypothetical protein
MNYERSLLYKNYYSEAEHTNEGIQVDLGKLRFVSIQINMFSKKCEIKKNNSNRLSKGIRSSL